MAASTEVVPGVHRLGSERVNWYFVEDGGRITIVDAAVPGYWAQLEPALAAIGRRLEDVEALVLTHAHGDHTGVAGRLHERGVPVYLHPGYHELLRTGKEPWKRERSPFPQILRLDVWRFFIHMMRNGALKAPRIEDPVATGDGERLSSDESLASLEKIVGLGAATVLVGHGEPWTDGVEAAVARARAAGPS